MRRLTSLATTLLLLATFGVPAESPAAAPVVSKLKSVQKAKLRRQILIRRRSTGQRLRPLGGGAACPATSVVTATDELGAPFFPFTLTPITGTSFAFASQTPRLPGPSPTALRILSVLDDPPMFTLATPGLGNLVMDLPGSGAIVGSSGSQLFACTIAPARCTLLHDFHAAVVDLAAAGNGTFVALTVNGFDGTLPVRLDPDGTETRLATLTDMPAFFARSVAVVGGRVYVGGYREVVHPTLTSVIYRVPLDGGFVSEVAELGTANDENLFTGAFTATDRALHLPQRMAAHGSDLLVATDALIVQHGSSANPEPSHLLRLRLGAAGEVTATDEIPIAADGMIHAVDLESLGSDAFIVDSRVRDTFGIGFDGRTGQPFPSGRILRVCIPD